jgi:hypothetical protein
MKKIEILLTNKYGEKWLQFDQPVFVYNAKLGERIVQRKPSNNFIKLAAGHLIFGGEINVFVPPEKLPLSQSLNPLVIDNTRKSVQQLDVFYKNGRRDNWSLIIDSSCNILYVGDSWLDPYLT